MRHRPPVYASRGGDLVAPRRLTPKAGCAKYAEQRGDRWLDPGGDNGQEEAQSEEGDVRKGDPCSEEDRADSVRVRGDHPISQGEGCRPGARVLREGVRGQAEDP